MEVDKDALLVRAALDIMAFQSQVARLEKELRALQGYRAAVETASRQVFTGQRKSGTLDAVKRAHVLNTYRQQGGRVDKVAKVLGIGKRQAYNLLPVNIRLERKRTRGHRDSA